MKPRRFGKTIWAIIILVAAFMGCKKEMQSKKIHESTPSLVNIANYMTSENIGVNSYGFLVFTTVKDLDDYLSLVRQSTHAEVQDYLSSLGVTTLGATLYSYSSDTVTEAESYDYVYNRYHIFQVKDVIFEPIGEAHNCSANPFQFMLAMNQNYLSSTTYQELENGTFDSNSMNKFATNPANQTVTLFDFMRDTPTGYEATTASSCPNPINDPRKFWGYGAWDCGPCDQTGHKSCHRNYYVFWIHVDTDYSYPECGAH